MKAKLLASLLVIGLVAALIGGATMAWFTDEAQVAEAEFVAGTVVINADVGEEFIKVPDGKSFKNVNPGDCATVTWKFVNEGTKAIELRVKLTELWEATTDDSLPGFDKELSTDNVFFAPLPDSGWVMYEDEDGELWLYYANGPIRGTFNYGNEEEPLDPEEVTLTLVVGFDGEATDNDYQGATYILGGSAIDEETGEIIGSVVQAVQASNNAPEAVWGSNFWNAVKAAEGLYAGEASDENLAYVYANYFLNGNGKYMPCWTGGEEPGPTEFIVDASDNIGGLGYVSGAGTYATGEAVTLKAQEVENHTFLGWYVGDVCISEDFEYTFTPSGNVTVVAVYDELDQFIVTLKDDIKDIDVQLVGAGSYYDGEEATVEAPEVDGYEFIGWYEGDTELSTNPSYTFNVTEDITLTAKYAKTYTITTEVGRYSGGWKTGDYGTVTLNPAGGSYKAGESVTISVSNKHGDGYTFQKWERKQGSAWVTESNNQSFTYKMPSYNVQFRAVFRK